MTMSRLRAAMSNWLMPKVERNAANGTSVTFQGFWENFDPERDTVFWTRLLSEHVDRPEITILGPFGFRRYPKRTVLHRLLFGKWDVYVTAENTDHMPRWARTSIGFRKARTPNEFRFPNWMHHLTWPGMETDPAYHRFGERLSIDQLKRSINDTHGPLPNDALTSGRPKALLVSSHLWGIRGRLYEICAEELGCDGFGGAFRLTDLPKRDLMKPYVFNLCPENSVGEGYITEKIPEAFLAGCVPITYCRPEDLALDFNPRAVVNLHGLSEQQMRQTLRRLGTDRDAVQGLRSEPLVTKDIDLAPLIDFLSTAVSRKNGSGRRAQGT